MVRNSRPAGEPGPGNIGRRASSDPHSCHDQLPPVAATPKHRIGESRGWLPKGRCRCSTHSGPPTNLRPASSNRWVADDMTRSAWGEGRGSLGRGSRHVPKALGESAELLCHDTRSRRSRSWLTSSPEATGWGPIPLRGPQPERQPPRTCSPWRARKLPYAGPCGHRRLDCTSSLMRSALIGRRPWPRLRLIARTDDQPG